MAFVVVVGQLRWSCELSTDLADSVASLVEFVAETLSSDWEGIFLRLLTNWCRKRYNDDSLRWCSCTPLLSESPEQYTAYLSSWLPGCCDNRVLHRQLEHRCLGCSSAALRSQAHTVYFQQGIYVHSVLNYRLCCIMIRPNIHQPSSLAALIVSNDDISAAHGVTSV